MRLALLLFLIVPLLAASPSFARPASFEPTPACPRHVEERVLEAASAARGPRPEESAWQVRASACGAWPGDSSLTVAVVAAARAESDTDAELTKVDLVVALVERDTPRVRAHHVRVLDEDAGFRIDESSLALDRAVYRLKPGVAAFGVDVLSGYIPNCADQGVGPLRTLYVREGSRLVPVLEDVPLRGWVDIVPPPSRCNWGADEARARTARYRTTIAVVPRRGADWAQLVVSVRRTEEARKPAPPRTRRLVLEHDGERYGLPGGRDWQPWTPFED